MLPFNKYLLRQYHCPLKKGVDGFNSGVIWTINNGEKVRLRWNTWLKEGTLRGLCIGLKLEVDMKVKEFISPSGGWDFGKISFHTPESVENSIRAIPSQTMTNLEDSIIRKIAMNGCFSIKFAWEMIISEKMNVWIDEEDGGWI
ncbi:hypothetical protein ACH5RR_029262 [Cinchona calisaya]|uniref:Uncharacterized protein n=1 Tax=Cinchona calisaya TaxID=153742 RepID=A0ABD2YTD5_9GENT